MLRISWAGIQMSIHDHVTGRLGNDRSMWEASIHSRKSMKTRNLCTPSQPKSHVIVKQWQVSKAKADAFVACREPSVSYAQH